MKLIKKEKIKRYREITSKAKNIAQKFIAKGREKEAEEIINMVSNYISDSEYFEKKGDYVSSFAALNYAHGWLDAGAKLGIFEVSDNNFFTIK
ncbi:MAG: DUF357 domain-containing protein [Candidatus Pacearchaeota archaeon]